MCYRDLVIAVFGSSDSASCKIRIDRCAVGCLLCSAPTNMREGQDLKEYWKLLKAAAQSLDSRSRNLFLTARAKHSGDDEVEGGPFCHTLGWNYGLTDETAEEILQRCASRAASIGPDHIH